MSDSGYTFSASQVLLQLYPCHSLRTLWLFSYDLGWLMLSLRGTALPNLQEITLSFHVSSAANFNPLHSNSLDEYLSKCCPELHIVKLIMTFNASWSTTGRGDREDEHVVHHAIEVSSQSHMVRTIRNAKLFFVLVNISDVIQFRA